MKKQPPPEKLAERERKRERKRESARMEFRLLALVAIAGAFVGVGVILWLGM